MTIRDIFAVAETLKDVCDDLEMIDFSSGLIEPRDDAEANDWRDYALDLADKIALAERAVNRAVEAIKG